MVMAITKMSANGQLVIPAEIRQTLDLDASRKFMIVSEGNKIYLEPIKEKKFKESFLNQIKEAEEDIKNGRFITLDMSKTSFKDFDKIMKERAAYLKLQKKQ